MYDSDDTLATDMVGGQVVLGTFIANGQAYYGTIDQGIFFSDDGTVDNPASHQRGVTGARGGASVTHTTDVKDVVLEPEPQPPEPPSPPVTRPGGKQAIVGRLPRRTVI
jgi:hypothetical protein